MTVPESRLAAGGDRTVRMPGCLMMATAQKPRFRNKAPDESKWNAIRPEFERLYNREGRKLSEVRTILAEFHDFHAA